MKNDSLYKNYCCRLCQSRELVSVLELASTPPANAFISEEKLKMKQKKYPLELYFCTNCYHVQLLEVVNPKELFEDYVYVSGTSDVFVNHFMNFAKDVVDKFKPSLNNYVLDIGSNDGTLLKFFKEMGYRCFAAGDSHNDIQMFEIADKGFFMNAPLKISSLHPEIDSFDSYNDLEEAILKYSIYVDHE